MKNKLFLEFLAGKENLPAYLKKATEKDILLSFNAKSIIIKFLSFQFLGAIFSMTVCPQFGLGLVEGHGITHVFRMIGDWACAAFCGSLFLSSGLVVAFIGMKGEELWWMWRRYKFSLILLPALLWGLLMLTNVTMSLPGETPVYHFTWLAFAIMVQVLWLEVRSYVVARKFAHGSRG